MKCILCNFKKIIKKFLLLSLFKQEQMNTLLAQVILPGTKGGISTLHPFHRHIGMTDVLWLLWCWPGAVAECVTLDSSFQSEVYKRANHPTTLSQFSQRSQDYKND